jgi:hypothetical protein
MNNNNNNILRFIEGLVTLNGLEMYLKIVSPVDMSLNFSKKKPIKLLSKKLTLECLIYNNLLMI